MRTRRKPLILSLLIVLAVGLFLFQRQAVNDRPRADLALITSLPIYWAEGADIAALAAGKVETPWTRQELEQSYQLYPLDSLDPEGGFDSDQFDRLLIVQPRGLSPQDNVALDNWVNAGGRLLIIIDPLLTGQYSVPISDPRHPIAIGLVPPVLERWGLGISYDEGQPFGMQSVNIGDVQLPYAMAGQVILLNPESGNCTASGAGIVAQCNIGRGRVTLLADAALFEYQQGSGELRKSLNTLTEMAFE